MSNHRRYQACSVALSIVIIMISSVAGAGDAVTVSGTVTGLHQIVGDDGIIYQIGEGVQGAELGKMVGAKVRVTAGIEEAEGEKVLTVKSYEVIGQ